MKSYEWLEDPVYEYVLNNQGVEGVAIVHHFKIVEPTLAALNSLIDKGRIFTKWFPLQLPQGATCVYTT